MREDRTPGAAFFESIVAQAPEAGDYQ